MHAPVDCDDSMAVCIRPERQRRSDGEDRVETPQGGAEDEHFPDPRGYGQRCLRPSGVAKSLYEFENNELYVLFQVGLLHTTEINVTTTSDRQTNKVVAEGREFRVTAFVLDKRSFQSLAQQHSGTVARCCRQTMVC